MWLIWTLGDDKPMRALVLKSASKKDFAIAKCFLLRNFSLALLIWTLCLHILALCTYACTR